MSTSLTKAAANRINGRKSQGPINTVRTRFNAAKHGLLAVGITELDDVEGYRTTLENLRREKAPNGILEEHLVESAALDMVRWRRARRLEAEYITGELNPPILESGLLNAFDLSEPTIVEPGLPARISFESAQRLVTTFQRYETSIAFRLFRTLHELERLQRIRQGERMPAPATVDVNIHADTTIADSGDSVLEQPQPLLGDQK